MKAKIFLLVFVYLLVFVNIFLLNVVVHEVGHFLAADYYGLEPEIDFEFQNVTGAGFNFDSIPVAYTSFIDNNNDLEIGIVALMGIFVNFLLGIFFLYLFVFWGEKFNFGEVGIIGMVVSFGAGLMNLIPFDGSDGVLIWGMV